MKYLLVVAGVLLSGCATTQPGPPASDYCQVSQPVRVSPKDTRATKEQADREFRKWKSICQPTG